MARIPGVVNPRLSAICRTSVDSDTDDSGASASTSRRTYKATSISCPYRSHINACGIRHNRSHNSASRRS
ncbi:hypothetical protein [Streptomyces bauhiniae]|uniref:Uncharacterized protein n=1 Tax=Streptomyces bauhiniae TaxID=2340725 RepID=A0A7K3QRB7_9ACTN|nr:hypothetical protein [Streptomyces bauhiniae]NEB92436.1 hypothetical protein [Streptomyces bauhiniae]